MEAFLLRKVKFLGLSYVANGDTEFTLEVSEFLPDFTALHPVTNMCCFLIWFVFCSC